MSLADDFEGAYSKYVTSPSKQLNLGWTVTSLYYSMPVIIGLAIILYVMLTILFNDSYLSGTQSKRTLIFIAWVGFAMIVFGLFLTVKNFTAVVKRINANIRVFKEDSLFQADTAVTSFISTVNRGTNNISTRDALEDPVAFAANPAASLAHTPRLTRESLVRNQPTPFRSKPKSNAQAAAQETSQDLKASASNIDRADKSTSQSLNAMQAVVNALPKNTEQEKKAAEALQANIAKVADNTAQVQAEAKHIKDAAPVVEQVADAAAALPRPARSQQVQGPSQVPTFGFNPAAFFAPQIQQGAAAPRAAPPQVTDAGNEIDFGGGFTYEY